MYQNIPKLMNGDLMGGDKEENIFVELVDNALSFARTSPGQTCFQLVIGVSSLVFLKSLKTREGQKRLLRWIFNFVLVFGF